MGISDQGPIVKAHAVATGLPKPIKRRHATILFSDISSSTQLAELCDPESLAIILGQVGKLVERISQHYGGVANQIHGDGALIVFGFPEPQENEVLAAIRAAIDLHRAVEEMDCCDYLPKSFAVKLHTGIHAGLIVAAEGDWMHGRYTLAGDALNTASRLSDAARAGEILVSESTLRGVLPYFQIGARYCLSLKGKRDIVVANNVVQRSPVLSRYDASVSRGLQPFVGRQQELQNLQALLAHADHHGLQVALVSGSAGVGKTRLVEYFIDQYCGNCEIHRLYCSSDASAIPLQPFLQLLSQLQAALDRNKSANVVAEELVSLLSQARRQLIFIDDWHWADDCSRDVLRELIACKAASGVLVIVASRALGFGCTVSPDCRLYLQPFARPDANQIVAAFFQQHYNDTIADTIYRRSGGNALFIEELCREQQRSQQPSDNVPAILHGLIESRLERLPDDYRALIRTAAVIGHRVPRDLFEKVLGYRLSDEVLLELSQLDLLRGDLIQGDLFHDSVSPDDLSQHSDKSDCLYFKHGLTRDIAYRSVLLSERKSLHLRVASILEADPARVNNADQLDLLADHFSAAEVREKAAHYYAAAASRRADSGDCLSEDSADALAANVAVAVSGGGSESI